MSENGPDHARAAEFREMRSPINRLDDPPEEFQKAVMHVRSIV